MAGFRKEVSDLVRPRLASPPGMTQALVDGIDAVFDRAGVARDDGSPPKSAAAPGADVRKELTDLLRPALATPPGMTADLVHGLDDIWNRCGVPVDGAAAAPKPAAAAAAAPAAAGTGTGTKLGNPAAFFASLKTAFGALNPSQTAGINDIIATCGAAKWGIAHTASALATAWLETAQKMQPVHEAFWVKQPGRDAYYKKMYDIQGQRPAKARELGNLAPGDGVKYHLLRLPADDGQDQLPEGADPVRHSLRHRSRPDTRPRGRRQDHGLGDGNRRLYRRQAEQVPAGRWTGHARAAQAGAQGHQRHGPVGGCLPIMR